jgi:hypothetical protein
MPVPSTPRPFDAPCAHVDGPRRCRLCGRTTRRAQVGRRAAAVALSAGLLLPVAAAQAATSPADVRLAGAKPAGMRPAGMRPAGMRPAGMRPAGMRRTRQHITFVR